MRQMTNLSLNDRIYLIECCDSQINIASNLFFAPILHHQKPYVATAMCGSTSSFWHKTTAFYTKLIYDALEVYPVKINGYLKTSIK